MRFAYLFELAVTGKYLIHILIMLLNLKINTAGITFAVVAVYFSVQTISETVVSSSFLDTYDTCLNLAPKIDYYYNRVQKKTRTQTIIF